MNTKMVPLSFATFEELKDSISRFFESRPDSPYQNLLVDDQGDTYLLSDILKLPDEAAKTVSLRFPGVRHGSSYSVLDIRQKTVLGSFIFNRTLANLLDSLKGLELPKDKAAILSRIEVECPITLAECILPTLTNQGYTYEWRSITQSLLEKSRDPCNRQPCDIDQLLLNKALIALLQLKFQNQDRDEKATRICNLVQEEIKIPGFFGRRKKEELEESIKKHLNLLGNLQFCKMLISPLFVGCALLVISCSLPALVFALGGPLAISLWAAVTIPIIVFTMASGIFIRRKLTKEIDLITRQKKKLEKIYRLLTAPNKKEILLSCLKKQVEALSSTSVKSDFFKKGPCKRGSISTMKQGEYRVRDMPLRSPLMRVR